MADVNLSVGVASTGVNAAINDLERLREKGLSTGTALKDLGNDARKLTTALAKAQSTGDLGSMARPFTNADAAVKSLTNSLKAQEKEYRTLSQLSGGNDARARLSALGDGNEARGRQLAREIQMRREAANADPVRDLMAVEAAENRILEEKNRLLAQQRAARAAAQSARASALVVREDANLNNSRAKEDLANQRAGLDAVARSTIALNRANADLARSQEQLRKLPISTSNAALINQRTAALQQETRALNQVAQAERDLAQAKENHGKDSNAFQSSYSYFILAGLATQASQAIIGMGGAAVTASAQVERSFADVDRTFDGTSGQLRSLQERLRELSTSTPNGIVDLSQIAALGNQLGIAATDIESFTTVLAQYTAISGQSAEESATAFGRISNLTGLAASQYENLASSITYVARTSVATESTITNTAKEISALATGAGFSAQSIVGLSGALSSLAIPPERARGALSLYFGALNTAIAEGGPKLEAFATVTGKTREELTNLVKSNRGQEVFTSFIQGLGELDSVAKTTALKELGLSTIRVDQTMRALAQNVPLVESAFEGANKAFVENNELSRQYAKIQATLDSKIKEFQNAILNAAAAVGDSLAPALADLLEWTTKTISAFVEFGQTPFGENLLQAAGIVAVIVAAIAGLIGALALAKASMVVFTFAMSGLNLSAAATGFAGLTASLLSTDAATRKAAFSVTAFRVALLEAGGAAAVLQRGLAFLSGLAVTAAVITSVVAAFTDLQHQMNYSADMADQLGASSEDLAAAMKADNAEYFASALKKSGGAASGTKGEVDGLNGAVAEMIATQAGVASGLDSTNVKLDEQKLKVGEATKEWINQSILQSEAMKRVLGQSGEFGNNAEGAKTLAAALESGFDLDKFSTATYEKGKDAGLAVYDGWIAALQEKAAGGDKKAQAAIDAMAGGLDLRGAFLSPIADGIEGAKTQALVAAAITKTGDKAAETEQKFDRYGNAIQQVGTQAEVAEDKFYGAANGIDEFNKNLASGLGSGLSFGTLFKDLENIAKEQKNPDLLNLDNFQSSLRETTKLSATFATDLGKLAESGGSSFATQLAAIGPKASGILGEALNLDGKGLAKLESSARYAAFLASDQFQAAFKANMDNTNAAYGRIFQETGDLADVRSYIAAQVRGAGEEWEIQWAANHPDAPLNVTLLNPTPADIAALNFSMDSVEVTAEVKPKYDGSLFEPGSKTYTDITTGASITLPANLSGEALKASLAEWTANQHATPAELEAKLNTAGLSSSVDSWISTHGPLRLTATVQITNSPTLPGLNYTLPSPDTHKDGGMMRYASGGEIPRFASGGGAGMFRGPGGGRGDKIQAWVSNGEYINTDESRRFWGADFFDSLNRKMLPTSFVNMLGAAAVSGNQGGPTTNVNVIQNNPVTRDPIAQLREDSEKVAAGLW